MPSGGSEPLGVANTTVRHHAWAQFRLVNVCCGLAGEVLGRSISGTYGSILATLRHLLEVDADLAAFLLDGPRPERSSSPVLIDELVNLSLYQRATWERVLHRGLDPLRDVETFRGRRPTGIVLAQALSHSAGHRAEVAVTMATFGVEPPDLSAWAFASAERD